MGETIRAAISRPRGRLGAIGLGDRLGPRGALAGDPVLVSAGGCRLALDVRRSAHCRRCWCSSCAAMSKSRRLPRRRAQSWLRAAIGLRSGRSSPARSLKTTILASLAVTGCQGGYYAITFWVPRFLTTERKLSIVGSTGYLATLIIGSFIGYLVGAWLADRIGRRNLFLYLLDRRNRASCLSIRRCR